MFCFSCRRPGCSLLFQLISIVALSFLSGSSFAAECDLYLAESTISNAGWGVFAGRDFETAERVEQPGLGILVIDSDRLTEEAVLLQYLWRSTVSGGFHEAVKVRNFLPGVGALANFHASESNVVEGGFTLDDTIGGSMTAYHNYSFLASRDIIAGNEILVGGAFLCRDDQNQDFPNEKDWVRAKDVISGLEEFRRKHPGLSEIQWIDFLYRLKNEMLDDAQRVKQILPDTLDELLIMKENLSPETPNATTRDLEWIQENGYCLDSIKEGVSTINGAGRGAFATRSIEKGSVVAPAPIIPVNASAFALEHRGPNNGTIQLLGNYCFGNSAATDQMLFCPLTQIGLMNHRSNKPNAAIRWGKASRNRKDADVNLLLDDISKIQNHYQKVGNRTNAPLMLEVYALEEIQEGDEVFLDYTANWENVFADHARRSGDKIPSATSQGITYISEDQVVVVSSDLPTHVTYQCRIEPLGNEESRGKVVEEDYRGRPFQLPERQDPYVRKMFRNNEFVAWHPCEVSGSNDDGITYKAVVHSKNRPIPRIMRMYHNVPRDAVRIVPKAYQSTQHDSDSFRHFIPIPEMLFPARWRADYVRGSDLRLGNTDTGIDVHLAKNFEQHSIHERKLRDVKCGNYFAPSNIPEAGFSQYTAVPYAGKGLTIASFMPSLIIPTLFKDGHNWIINDYVWEGRVYSGEYEIGKDRHTEALGASLANFHPGILNMDLRRPTFNPLLDACKDPGAGASTDYEGCAFRSSQALSAGEELFISYGDAWFYARTEFGDIAVSTNYADSNRMLAAVWALSSAGGKEVFEKDEVTDIISFVKKKLVQEPRTRSALQNVSTWADLKRVVARNGTAIATMELRSLEWFEEHGQCMDHIYVRESTIRQAGHGAFSRRHLVEGTTIISSPMIHVWGRETMDFNLSLVDDAVPINPSMQLLNYQFSHPKSTVYLLPINQMIGINHNSARSDSGQVPNAKLRWATWNKKSIYALQRPLEDLKKEPYSTIVMDVVATRDILPDEEVFIDYGEEWEAAWAEHVRNWKPPCQNGDGDRTLSSFVINEMNKDKYNSSLWTWGADYMTVCKKYGSAIFSTVVISEDTSFVTSGGDSNHVTDNYEGITVGDDGFKYSSFDDLRMPCKIRRMNQEEKTFEAILFLDHLSSIEIHRKMSDSNVYFLPRPYKSDMHLPRAFRHEIKIPDEMFPRHWMDLGMMDMQS